MDTFTQVGFLVKFAAFSLVFVLFLLAATAIFLVCLYFYDKYQNKHTILKNYPILGHARFIFEYLGHFFRQYLYAGDREELPFNRATRSWVYQAAKGVDTTVAFGSTQNITETGSKLFVNAPFPTLKKNALKTKPMVIGPHSREPYEAQSFFNVSAMSYGALSKVAVKALSSGCAQANCWLNTGEGGISPYHLEGGCDLVAQIGTAKYGYRDLDGNLCDQKLKEAASHKQVKMFEIKLSQGAKPGKGGLLPGNKVTKEIAKIRGIKEHEDSISPNRFTEMSNIGDILDFINHVRDVTGKPVGIKFVVGCFDWIHELCKQINKRGIECAPDYIAIDSCDGGTGAAPLALIDNVGLHIKESLPKVIDILKLHQLKDRIKIVTAGKLLTPSEIAWALAVGADFVVTARGFMFALGCIQALKCNQNTCPTGITTHDKNLQKGLVPKSKAKRVASYVERVQDEVSQIAHSCGVREPRELTRSHCRIVQENGKSITLQELYRDNL